MMWEVSYSFNTKPSVQPAVARFPTYGEAMSFYLDLALAERIGDIVNLTIEEK